MTFVFLCHSYFAFCVCFVFFFFFQAEDGIRDRTVTGVQTCALPICAVVAALVAPGEATSRCQRQRVVRARTSAGWSCNCGGGSEERRVGKECRSRWWPDD